MATTGNDLTVEELEAVVKAALKKMEEKSDFQFFRAVSEREDIFIDLLNLTRHVGAACRMSHFIDELLQMDQLDEFEKKVKK